MTFTEINFDEARNAARAIQAAGEECEQASSDATTNLTDVDNAVAQLRATQANVDRLLNELDTSVGEARNRLDGATWVSGSRDNLSAAIADIEAAVRTARTNYESTYAEALAAAERLQASIDEITRAFVASCGRNGPAFLDAAAKGFEHIEKHERLSGTDIALG